MSTALPFLVAWLLAADPAQADIALAAAVRSCAELPHEAERLACYDAAVGRDAAADAEPPAAAPPEAAEETFGLEDRLRREAESVDSIVARVQRLTDLLSRQRLIELDNGQVWRQLERVKTVTPKVGESVRIKRAAFGSFRMVTETGRSAPVRREQ